MSQTQRRSLLSAAVAVCMAAGPAVYRTTAADNFEIDKTHSSVGFRVKHLNVSYLYGRFKEIRGKIVWDKDNPENSSIEARVRASTVDTGDRKRDQHLKGPDFFNTKEFRVLSFKSKSIKKLDDDMYEVTGDLECHGVTKEITIKLEKTGEANTPRMGYRIGFETTFTIDRGDFGMNYMPGGIGDEVRITISLEAVRKEARKNRGG